MAGAANGNQSPETTVQRIRRPDHDHMDGAARISGRKRCHQEWRGHIATTTLPPQESQVHTYQLEVVHTDHVDHARKSKLQ